MRETYQYPLLSLKVQTDNWMKNSQYLFDYTCKNKVKTNIQVNHSCKIVMDGDKGMVVPYHSVGINPILEILATKDDGFIIREAAPDLYPVWLIVSSLTEMGGYRLQNNDIVRIGKTVLRVKGIGCSDPASDSLNLQDNIADRIGPFIHQEPETSSACRICFCEDVADDNPLLSPCRCSGTVKHIHLLCLKRWLDSRLTTRFADEVVSYYWDSFGCELCKTQYPMTILTGDRSFELIQIAKPKGPHLILENYRYSDMTSTGIHVLSFRKFPKLEFV